MPRHLMTTACQLSLEARFEVFFLFISSHGAIDTKIGVKNQRDLDLIFERTFRRKGKMQISPFEHVEFVNSKLQ